MRDVNLTLRRGERIALVGASGSGKSTPLRVIAGLYEAERGFVVADGQVLYGRRQLGDVATLIPKEAEVLEAAMRENITFDQQIPEAELWRAVHASALDAVLDSLPQGLDTPMSERGFNLSRGQRQRLALTRGVLAARGSSLLLLDEPTSSLDAVTEQRVFERLFAAHPTECILASVHRLALLVHFDRVVFMVDGQARDSGGCEELRQRVPAFAALLADAQPQRAPLKPGQPARAIGAPHALHRES